MLIQLSINYLVCKLILSNFQIFRSPNLLILKRRVISQSSLNYKTQIFCQKLIVFQIYSHTSQELSINLQFSLFPKMLQTLFMLKAFLLMHLKEKFLIFLDLFLVTRLSVWSLVKRNLAIKLFFALLISNLLCKQQLSLTLSKAIALIKMIF